MVDNPNRSHLRLLCCYRKKGLDGILRAVQTLCWNLNEHVESLAGTLPSLT